MDNVYSSELPEDPTRIVRSWRSSRVIYKNGNSKEFEENPDYHPEICLTADGDFVDSSGKPLDKSTIPAHILAESTPPPLTVDDGKREVSMRDVMTNAGVSTATGEPGLPPAAPPSATAPGSSIVELREELREARQMLLDASEQLKAAKKPAKRGRPRKAKAA